MKISFPSLQTSKLSYNSGILGKKYPNLSPLSKDTVSFSASAKLIAEHMNIAPSQSLCSSVAYTAEPARFYLESVLNKYIGKYVDNTDEKSTKKFPVLECTTRVKTPTSIREKVVSKYSKMYSTSAKNFSKDLIDELSKSFTLVSEDSKENISNEIYKLIYNFGKDSTSLVSSNIPLFFSIAVTYLREMGYFDFASIPDEKQRIILTNIMEELETKNSDDLPNATTQTKEGIKYYANDIVGGRIILRDSDPANTGKVIEALKEAVSDKKLKITGIQNNIPDPEKLPYGKTKSSYSYATDAQLHSLANTSGGELQEIPSKSGYLAIHIDVDLSNYKFSKLNRSFDGYQGEIQIIGRDVEQLKQIEDLCYKLKDNKNAIKAEYLPFKTHFLNYYKGENRKIFNDYTYDLYLAQRSLEFNPKRSTFPSMQLLGYGDLLPAELDFNNLKLIKDKCDAQIKLNESAENSNQTKSKTKNTVHQDLDEDIKLAKNVISFMM